MKKIITLLILVLFSTSCSNNNYDAHNEINNINTNEKIKENLADNISDQSNNIIDVEDIDVIDMWNWFELDQTLEESTLIYKWNKIEAWSHTSEVNPFKWDDACSELFEVFLEYSSDNIEDYKQKAWKSLGSEWQKLCIKESLSKDINLKQFNNTDYYIITKSSYWWYSIKVIYNTSKNIIIKWNFWQKIYKIEESENWTYFINWNSRWCWSKSIYLKEENKDLEKIISSNCDNYSIDDENYIMITDFEQIDNNQIKVFYLWKDNIENETIINIK